MQGGGGAIRRGLPCSSTRGSTGPTSADAAAAQRAAASRLALPRQAAVQTHASSAVPAASTTSLLSSVLCAPISGPTRDTNLGLVAPAAAAPASSFTALRLVDGSGAGRLGAVGTRPPAGQLPGVALRAGGTVSQFNTVSTRTNTAAPAGAIPFTELMGSSDADAARARTSGLRGNGVGKGEIAVVGQGLCPNGFVQKERFRFSLGDLAVSTTVGTGTFGRVCVAQHIDSSRWYALKILKKSEILQQRQLEHIKSEVRILSTVRHPFIVDFHGHMQNARRLYMLFEYVPGGELFSHLRHEGKLRESAARFYAAEIVLALEYLHELDILYRDLKPENLLLTASGHIKLTDFGFAKTVVDRTFSLCGTPEYLAPEIIQTAGHGKGVDWWALGILIYEMLAGFPPFNAETQHAIYAKICAGEILWPRSFSSEAKDLIRRRLTADRSKRLGCLRGGASDVKEHAWFSPAGGKLDWDRVYRMELTPPFVPRVAGVCDTSNFDSYPDSDGDTAKELAASENVLFAELEAI